VEPFLMEFADSHEQTIQKSIKVLSEKGWEKEGQWLVVITNALADEKVIDTLQLRQIEE